MVEAQKDRKIILNLLKGIIVYENNNLKPEIFISLLVTPCLMRTHLQLHYLSGQSSPVQCGAIMSVYFVHQLVLRLLWLLEVALLAQLCPGPRGCSV